jgi:hypothetical protein
MSWNLANLVPEVLSDITSFLSGYDITNLYMIGSSSLNRALTQRGGVKCFVLEANFPNQLLWPKSVSYFQSLECFKFKASIDVYHLEVKDVNIFDIPKSVKYVQLKFLNGWASLWTLSEGSSTPTPRRISDIWPRLETLKYLPQNDQVIPEKFDIFPESLTYINLRHNFELPCMQLVPRTVLKMFVGLAQPQDWSADPHFPPQLRILTIRGVSSRQALRYLPITLQELDLDYTNEALQDPTEKEMLETLPPDLVSLRTYVRLFSSEAGASLPRALKRLWVHQRMRNAPHCDVIEATNILKSLPPSLRYFEISGMSSRLPLLQVVPNNPNSLDQLEKMALALPKMLQFVSSDFLSFLRFNLKHLPPGLTHLNLGKRHINRKESALIPRTVTSLSAGKFYDENDDPVLRMMGAMTAARMLNERIEAWSFPPRLRALGVLDGMTPASLHSALSTCPELSSLEIPLTGASYTDCLPPRITKLSLSSYYQDLPILSHLTKLESLIISRATIVSANFFSSLPPSLCSFTFNFTNITKNLPSHPSSRLSYLHRLRTLDMTGIEMLEDDSISNLPPNLTSLSLSTYRNKITAQGLAKLPPSLTFLSMPDGVEDALPDNLRNLAAFFLSQGNSPSSWLLASRLREQALSDKYMGLVYPVNYDDE